MQRLKSYLKQFPFFVYIYKKYVVIIGKLRFFRNKIMFKTYSEEDLYKMFSKIGITPGDRVFIHSSMSKIGVLKEGPITFVNALKKYIGKDGLIVMPTFPSKSSYDYLTNYQIFDVKNTPSINGAITECFRKSHNVFRSIHPTHPLAAWGKDAEELMKGHEKTKSMFDEKSPYKKLIDLNIKILLIGVNFDHMTMMRVVEDTYDKYMINPYCEKKFVVNVIGYNNELISVETNCHDPKYFGKNRENMQLYSYLENDICFGYLGQARTMLINSHDMYAKQIECCNRGIYPYRKYRFKN